MYAGMMGNPKCMANMDAPFLKRCNLPSGDRVPSGYKISPPCSFCEKSRYRFAVLPKSLSELDRSSGARFRSLGESERV